jgi:diguanylate cyclase (GGDEF)-like protein/PAS domain S-box-containing protein
MPLLGYVIALASLAVCGVLYARMRRDERRRAALPPYELLLRNSYGWECWLADDGQLLWVNDAVERLTGYSVAECRAMVDFPVPIVLPDDRPQILRLLREATAGRCGDDHLFRIRRKDNRIAWVTAAWQRVPGVGGIRVSLHDVTRRKIVDETLRRIDEQFRLFVETSKDRAIILLDATGRVISWNPGAARILGYQPYEILGKKVDVFYPAEDAARIGAMLASAAGTGWCEEHGWRVRKDGSRYWADEVISVLRNDDDSIRGYAVVMRDVTAQKRAEEELRERNARLEQVSRQLRAANAELQRLARTDPLTGLLNRRAWEEAAEREHHRAVRSGAWYSVLAIDLDHFKLLNDTFGHQAGDECLRRVAEAIGAACRASDLVGRMGGEEFAVLAPETSLPDALELAERLRNAISGLGISNPSSPVARVVTASVGVAVGGGAPLAEAMKTADEALYNAKRTGRDRVCHSPNPVLAP